MEEIKCAALSSASRLSVIWFFLIAAVGFLMVSTWRFYSFKDIDLRSRHPFWAMILLGGLVALIWFFSRPVLFLIALTYMLSGVLARFSFAVRRRDASPPTATTQATEV